ncbi:MAG TPA: FkbM family methyltransferase, partial [bacterium]|nr:FkbM family methyltransferase [bacterium]
AMVQRILLGISRRLSRFAQRLNPDPHQESLRLWFEQKGDKTHRVQYDLREDSVVFDLGGYEGAWASDIFSRYVCTIYVFEPVAQFVAEIRRRFARNPKIGVYDFGLSDRDQEASLSISSSSSSLFKSGGKVERIRLRQASAFMKEKGISHVDLMKINIEGGEYDLLEHLLDVGFIEHITNLQIQFHDFVPQSRQRMEVIQRRLSETHELTYRFPFIWENWQRKGLRHK